MLFKTEECNQIRGLKPSPNAPSVSHLQYANDTLLFCDAINDQAKKMVAILRCFEAVFGLNINLPESAILGVSVDASSLHHLAGILGCKVDSFPSTYLGIPLCLGRVPISVWNHVLERIEKKLSSWKARYLSLGDRITLIQFALANLPIYYMSILKCPTAIINRIEKLQRDFLWHGCEYSKKIHMVN